MYISGLKCRQLTRIY